MLLFIFPRSEGPTIDATTFTLSRPDLLAKAILYYASTSKNL